MSMPMFSRLRCFFSRLKTWSCPSVSPAPFSDELLAKHGELGGSIGEGAVNVSVTDNTASHCKALFKKLGMQCIELLAVVALLNEGPTLFKNFSKCQEMSRLIRDECRAGALIG
jgi:hypothetical protein